MQILLAFLLLAPACQEPPLGRGAYRGPFDEVLAESAKTETGVTSGEALDSWDRWEFWLEFEKHALFVREPAVTPYAEGLAAGAGSRTLDRELVLQQAVPILVDALTSPHAPVREAAALSLGRIGDPASSAAPLLRALGDASGPVRNAALLALGMIGEGEGLSTLAVQFSEPGLARDRRAFAALGLGLSGRPEALDLLNHYLKLNLNSAFIVGDEETVVQAAVWAAGALGSRELVPVLITGYERLERTATSASLRVRTLVLQALGKCGDPEAYSLLRRALGSESPAIKRAAAQALGWLGDARALPVLARTIREESDAETLNFCLLAIGRIGGADAEARLHELLPVVSRHRQHRACWCIAAGLAGSSSLLDEIESGFATRTAVGPQATEYRRRDEERLRGAQAIAMGLEGDPRLAEVIQTVLNEPGTGFDLTGHCAMGLGLLGGRAALESLLLSARSGSTHEDFRRGLAWGLGLTGDPEASQELARILLEDRRHGVRWAAAHACGLARSPQAMQMLVQALADPGEVRRSEEETAHLVLALGFLGDRHREDRLGSLIAGLNYRQEFPLLRALSGY